MVEPYSLHVLEPKDLICFENENYTKMSVWSQQHILTRSEKKIGPVERPGRDSEKFC